MHARSTPAKLALLTTLYLSQGLPYGFFTQALPVMMRESGHTLEQIGYASLLAVPWALKFLWAPCVDRYGSTSLGRRKSWIVPLQLVTAAVLFCAGFLDPAGSFMQLFAIVLVVNALSATQDVATDGLAVDMLAHRERGLANGIQVAGYRIGMILGGGVLLIFFAYLGWQMSFIAMAALIVLATVPISLYSEGVEEHLPREPALPSGPHFLRLPGVGRLLTMLFALKFGETMATTMLRPFLVDLGFGLGDVGVMIGTVGFLAGLSGALAGGWLAGRLPRKNALLICASVQALALAAYVTVALAPPGRSFVACIIALEHVGGGMATAALFTCMMDWCRREQGATDYTVQASTVVIASSLAAALSGLTAQWLGYVGHFALTCALAVIAVVLVARLFPKALVASPHQLTSRRMPASHEVPERQPSISAS